jgi:hypothetical protein
MVKTGTRTSYYIPGLGSYLFAVDSMGNVKIYGAYTTPDHTAVIKEGIDAEQLGKVWCSKQTTVGFGKGSTKKCVEYSRNAIEREFDLVTGKYTQRTVTQKTNAINRCYSTGKDSGVCKAQPNYAGFQTAAVNNIFTQSISIADILKHNQSYTLKTIKGNVSYLRGMLDKSQNHQSTGKG